MNLPPWPDFGGGRLIPMPEVRAEDGDGLFAVGGVAVLSLDTLVDELLLDVPYSVDVVSAKLCLLHPLFPFLVVAHRSYRHCLLFVVNGLHLYGLV